jgi:bifunctional DNase/RNase
MLVHALFFVALAGLLACDDASTNSDPNVPMSVGVVAVDEHDLPVVVLEEQGGPRLLPIWIGAAEARSIAVEMEQKPALRPNTHDLATRLIQSLEGEIVRVVVNELRNGDAIAIALRVGAPIFVRASLLNRERSEPVADRAERQI